MTDCPCGSGSAYDECCGPFIAGDRPAPTAEKLMRSRYTAYTLKDADYIVRTTRPDQRKKVQRETVLEWAEAATWKGLEIVTTADGGEGDDDGMVEFIARYEEAGDEHDYRERARFSRIDGEWYFDHRRSAAPRLESAATKVGRNDPCPCGSGKKHKKCCGKV